MIFPKLAHIHGKRNSLAALENFCHSHHAAARNAKRRKVHLAMLLQEALHT
jgi:hypothetical protein